MTPKPYAVLVVLGLTLLASAGTAGAGAPAPGFEGLEPESDVIYLLARTSIVLGDDPGGPAEHLTFTGTAELRRFPAEGFERRSTADGRTQIDCELVGVDLAGWSHLLDGPVYLAEPPDHPSRCTLTQQMKGRDYPADLVVQRGVQISAPGGDLVARESVPVRAVVTALPPLRRGTRGAPVDLLLGQAGTVPLHDEEGKVAALLRGDEDVAYAVQPAAVYRFPAQAELAIRRGDEEEIVQLEGPMEIVERPSGEAGPAAEIVLMGLRGRSELLGGPVVIKESFRYDGHFSSGEMGDRSAFDLYPELLLPGGRLELPRPLHVDGETFAKMQIGEVEMGGGEAIPLYHVAIDLLGEWEEEVTTPGGATLLDLYLASERMAGRRPCCPREKPEEEAGGGPGEGGAP